jgi:hypothetical protein
VPNSDLDYAKTFQRSFRQKIVSDYKANRRRDPSLVEVASFIKKYYAYRGDRVVEVYSDEYEADDFVEPLVATLTGKIALLSTDLDWARYIDRCDLINKSWIEPLTADEFESTFEFKPTTATVVLYKSMFGDVSDNVVGAINAKRARFSQPIKPMVRDFLRWLGEKGLSLDEAINLFKTTTFARVISKDDRSPFDELYLTFHTADERAPVTDTMLKNAAVIRSQLEHADISKYSHSEPVREKTNSVLHEAVFGRGFKSSFGQV